MGLFRKAAKLAVIAAFPIDTIVIKAIKTAGPIIKESLKETPSGNKKK